MVDSDRLLAAYQTARCDLLAECKPAGHWTGHLASSAFATATAISALAIVERSRPTIAGRFADEPRECALSQLIMASVRWLARRQNADGGWGDTEGSPSNIATTMLVRDAFALTCVPADRPGLLERADAYIKSQGGLRGLRRRYGRDRALAVPILTNSALAGLVSWRRVPSLPFGRAALPAWLRRLLKMPELNDATAALVAVGHARYAHRKPWNPLARFTRRWALDATLAQVAALQPTSGGFLESPPLTSFVVMSLASSGRADHQVVERGVEFLLNTVRPDGSWPIATDLSVWNTTLALSALHAAGEDLSQLDCLEWLLASQRRQPGNAGASSGGLSGWSWTDRTGGAVDVDDTSGALLALANWVNALPPSQNGAAISNTLSETLSDTLSISKTLSIHAAAINGTPTNGTPTNGAAHNGCVQPDIATLAKKVAAAARAGVRWLLEQQNDDGGWPTFARGSGRLPFDTSGSDLTAHALRALHAWRGAQQAGGELPARVDAAIERGWRYLLANQRPDGAWAAQRAADPFRADRQNLVYGTSRVLAAFRDLGRLDAPAARRAIEWLAGAAHMDGSWGTAIEAELDHGRRTSHVEETALAVEALLSCGQTPADDAAAMHGLAWLVDTVEANRHHECSPIGLSFAQVGYQEQLYPLIWAVAALGRAARRVPRPSAQPAAAHAARS